MNSASLQDDLSVESFFNVVETEMFALFEYLSFEFLELPELVSGLLYCY